MNREVLFQITKENLETGLRGIPVGYCPTSTVHPEKGLFYVDHPISEIANWEPEEVIFLLAHGYEGKPDEIWAFKENLKKRATCSKEAIKYIYALPRSGHPMALFAAAILILGMHELTGDYWEDCLNLIAKTPHLTAAVINHHAGWGKTPLPSHDLGYVENFSHMLQLPSRRNAELTKIFKLFNILHYDHGGGNLSVFVGKAVASGLEDLYGSISSAMNALAGPRHGRANQECLHFVEELLSRAGDKPSEESVERIMRDKLANKELIYGFGHAVLRVEDPRATVLYQLASDLYGNNPLVNMALLIRKVGVQVLKSTEKITSPHPNVDAISGTLFKAAGIPYPEYYTILFGMSRIVGIAIQIVYERCWARGGKGTPIIRPKYIYQPQFKKIKK